eukprot:75625_1
MLSTIATINLSDLDKTSKLAYWIKHLPYFKYYKSHLQHATKTTLISKSIEINKSELLISQQIADIFYENSISGCTIDKFTKNDYNEILQIYKDSINIENDNNNNYIKYIYQLIYESQQYYQTNPNYNINVTEMKQLENKNWIIDTYQKYVLLITEILNYIPNNNPNDDCKSNQSIQNNINMNINNINNDNNKIETKKTETYPVPPTGEIYIRSPTSKWRVCTVIKVLENGKKWKIHYKDFNSKFDEIVDANSTRLTTNKPENVIPKKKSNKDRIWVQSASNKNIHRECKIIDANDTQYKIHFISYHEKHDMWIDKTSSRINKTRPLGNVLVKGDNLSCYNDELKLWVEVEVIKVDNKTNLVKVAWVGSNNLENIWVKKDDYRLSIKHKKHSDPAPQNK